METTTSPIFYVKNTESISRRVELSEFWLSQSRLSRVVFVALGFVILTHLQAFAASVGGYVYCDNNQNGSYDIEEGLQVPGLEVKFFQKNSDELITSSTTDNTGKYITNSVPDNTDIDVKVVYQGATYLATDLSSLSAVHIKVICTSTSCGAAPVVLVSKEGDLSCAQTSIKITALASPNEGANYDWIIPNGATDPGDTDSFFASVAGVYIVTVKYNNSDCIASNSITVARDETECCLTITDPDPSVPKSICEGESVRFSVKTNSLPPVEIGWVRFDSEVDDPYIAEDNGKTYLGSTKPSDGFATVTSDNFPAEEGSVRTYYVYACFKYASPFCKGFVKYQVNVLKPKVTATSGLFSCPTSSGQVTAVGVPSEGITPSYKWTGPGSFTSGLQNPTVSVAGSYEVTYSVTKDEKTCVVSDTAVVECCPVNICVPVIIAKTHSGKK